jgi:hypothetical protein
VSNALQGGEYSWGLVGVDRSEIEFDQSQYTLSIITSQLHCFELRTILNGKDFKFFSHGLCKEKQNILLQRMREKKLDFDQ